MAQYAVTVVGRDRPGIISETTGLLAALGVNIEDSSMTRLRGVFAFTLVCSGQVSRDDLERSLDTVRADASLAATVHAVAEEDAADDNPLWVLSVHGADHPGIVSAVTAVLADAGGNIVDLSTRLSGDLYVLIAEVSLPPTADVEALDARLRQVATEVGVGVTLRRSEADVL
jgi:glycine cleavage system transcriptional repressor